MGALCCCPCDEEFEEYALPRATLASSRVGTSLQNNPLNDAQLSFSKPTPFDANQRCSRLQREGLVSRCEKSMTYLQEDMQQLRRWSSGTEYLGFGKKWSGDDTEEYCNRIITIPSYKELSCQLIVCSEVSLILTLTIFMIHLTFPQQRMEANFDFCLPFSRLPWGGGLGEACNRDTTFL
ncbi:E3 ubiquitin-protein ligase [Pyrus ussuriensis x Pyrus communis]|uniref:E3 ubiquitin-protein ligase n=1 Tax=Pyrus ussuriensis x Pyrus communis TaxID=2448454 RepID=A0A5N5I4E1_9ROSA|nr:E3 ubiquitin-protein ligase [Pyrus ussuriensis x Pyrus communis]